MPEMETGARYEAAMQATLAGMPVPHDYALEVKWRHLRAALAGTVPPMLLDFGCGPGLFASRPVAAGWQVIGADLEEGALRDARRAMPGLAAVRCDGPALPLRDAVADAAVAVCVFHHVEPSARDGALRELRRVLCPGAPLFVFEHNPHHPLARRLVRRCAFDRDAQLLPQSETAARVRAAGFGQVRVTCVLAAPLPAAACVALDRRLGALPFGAQYMVSGRA